MYCNHCGALVAADQLVCRQCGKSPAEGRAALVARSRVPQHLHLLSIFWYVVGSILMIPVGVLVVMSVAIRYVRFEDLPPFMNVAGPFLFLVIATFVAAIAVAFLFTGWGLHKLKPWGRTLALIMGFIAIVHPPFGTELGIYTLYVLLSSDAGAEYERMAQAQEAKAAALSTVTSPAPR